jgi:PleD family two-component response regulator
LAQPIHTVTVLVGSPALSSILSMTLAAAPSLRVRPFESQIALTTYLRLAPAELVVADFDNIAARADRLAEDLRTDRSIGDLQIIALASALSVEVKGASIHAGIDEIIMKPMSPKYLLERVLARLAKHAGRQADPGPNLRSVDWSGRGDNVVSLFQRAPEHVV